MAEKNFKNTTSCELILKGLKKNLRKKRIPHLVIDDLKTVDTSKENKYLFLVSTNDSYIAIMVRECQKLKIHPIVISLQSIHSIPGIYSSVTPSVDNTMFNIMSFLKSENKIFPALYGISINSAPDIARKNCFLQKHVLPTGEEHVYFNHTGLDDCFKRFFANISKYDSVICTNNYAAIHLINNLKKLNYPTSDFIVIGCGKTLMAAKFYPEIVFAYVVNENLGKTAVTVLEQLINNTEVLHINMSVKSNISRVQNSSSEPLSEDDVVFEENSSDIFYKDPNIKNMLLIEKLLSICDPTDMQILDLVLEGSSYEDIANKTFLSQSAIKYRVKNMLQICGCSSKSQFVVFVKEYMKK